MTFRVKFSEQSGSFRARFDAVQTASDGGYERGYGEGYEVGNTEGYTKGYGEGETKGHEMGYSEGYEVGKADGLAARTYETWTFTLVDGTVVEKEVALI